MGFNELSRIKEFFIDTPTYIDCPSETMSQLFNEGCCNIKYLNASGKPEVNIGVEVCLRETGVEHDKRRLARALIIGMDPQPDNKTTTFYFNLWNQI